MTFIIDKDIYFRPDDGAIWRCGSEQETKYLTPANSRLLTFLIEQQGLILSRDEIFIAVWDKHGLRSSNHTLNQYISYLRKTFADFGLTTPLIKTIPKTGFIFSGDIAVTVDSIETPRQKEIPALVASQRRWLLPGMGLLVCGLALFLLLKKSGTGDFQTDYRKVTQRYQRCQVIHFRTSGATTTAPLSTMAQLIEAMGIDCRQEAWVILQDPGMLSDKRFAAVCRTENESHGFSTCQSHYQYD
ncbi:MAG: winged helix-turn-helix domain-containing protein [Scandinavium sp.]|uniref:winged helix-turn-helix domain-containing protein n=1 Tax=Scandinavium sp. TaxID=2830653 RepID=UPI003F3E00C1